MHNYASDNFFRGPRTYLGVGALAVISASTIQSLASLPPLAGFVDSTVVSAGAVYGGLIWFYDRWLWRWMSTIPNLVGTWAGVVTSSHNDGAEVPCVMHVRQCWTRMALELNTEHSRSRTTMAALYENQPGDTGLKYEYVCEPRNRSLPTMHTHRGVCMMAIAPGGDKLDGDYFTGRGRETHGVISLRRVSRKLLDYGTALTMIKT